MGKIKSTIGFFVGIAILSGLWSCSSHSDSKEQVRQRELFNNNWLFKKNDPTSHFLGKDTSETGFNYSILKNWLCKSGSEFSESETSDLLPDLTFENFGESLKYTISDFKDESWRKLRLPHDWAIEGSFSYDLPGNTGKLPFAGVGWYRKHFFLPVTDSLKQIYLDIDGAMAYPMVWLNGNYVGGWAYGYSSFRVDLTKYIKPGEENVLAIRVANPENSSRWYPGSGIYRNVWLVKTNPVHIHHWGTSITTPEITENEAKVSLEVTIDNTTKQSSDVEVSAVVRKYNGTLQQENKIIAETAVSSKDVVGKSSQLFFLNAAIENPELWSPDSPNLYAAEITVKESGKVVDSYETVFGIRTIKFDSEKGFILNGNHVEIKGVCNHHDLGALGTAFNIRAAERQLEILKEMGVNALRTSHNMPAPELLDLCDRMGILVMDESFDCWRRGKTENDYGVLFDDWHEKDLRAMVRRDRNHPSIIMWSIGNEVRELGSPDGVEIASELTAIVKGEDSTRPVIVGSNNPAAGFNGLQNTVDIYGQNYYTWVYDKFHTENPEISVLGSETSSCVSSRGEYFFPVSANKKEGKGRFQMSSYDLYAPSWGCTPDAEFAALDTNKYVSGEFVWTGFDYLGEPTPFNDDITNLLNFTDDVERAKMEKELAELGTIKTPSRSSYFGIVDLCGFRKDRFYLYQSRWRPDLPMVHILPHWNWPERIGKITPVHVYTSGDEAELFLNGKSMGRKKMEPEQYRIIWDSVVYERGTLKAISYKNGEKWAEEEVKTTGTPEQILLKADRDVIKNDGYDLSYITVTIADKDGNQVPRSDNRIKFSVSGPGEIVATDNGDPTSFESFQSKERNAFNGLALVIIRSNPNEDGTITLHAVADGLGSSEIQISSRNY